MLNADPLVALGAATKAYVDAVYPTWATSGRPSSPTAGQTGFNSTLGSPEWYDATSSIWVQYANPTPYVVSVMIIAGGGGGASHIGAGGGGAGGYISPTNLYVAGAIDYPVVIGAGGAGQTNNTVLGVNGGNSVFSSITSTGGGGGAGVTVNIPDNWRHPNPKSIDEYKLKSVCSR